MIYGAFVSIGIIVILACIIVYADIRFRKDRKRRRMICRQCQRMVEPQLGPLQKGQLYLVCPYCGYKLAHLDPMRC